MNTAVLGRTGRSHKTRVEARAGTVGYRIAETAGADQRLGSTPAPATKLPSRATRKPSRVVLLRTALVFTSVAAAATAGLLASGMSSIADPELALLLRGMAAIKGLLAAAALGAVWWRLGHPVRMPVALTYFACVSTLCATSVLIWQLAFIAAAAVLFHAAGLTALVLALREGRRMPRFVLGPVPPNDGVDHPSDRRR